MKKTFIIVIAALLTVSLASCDASQNNTENQSPISVNDEASVGEEEHFEIPKIDSSATIAEPTVIFDKNDIKVTANNLVYNSYQAEMDITIENNSGISYDYYAGAGGYACNSINGYMVYDGYATGNIEPGKTAIETVNFSYDELFTYGIDKIAEIQLGIMFKDNDHNRIYGGDVPIKTTAYDGYDFSKTSYSKQVKSKAIEKACQCSIENFKEEEFFSSDGVSIISALTITDKNGDSSLVLDVYNDSDEILYVDFHDLYINGLSMPYKIYCDQFILPKKHLITTSKINKDDLWKILGIEYADTIKFTVSLSNETHNEQDLQIKVKPEKDEFTNNS